MKLSINLNKIALLRNARGEGNPSVEDYVNKSLDLGVDGLTLHPRPDHRHATSDDVTSIANLCKKRNVEFNLEGNPFSEPLGDFKGFVNLVKQSQPDQITLVPDLPNQITSDHGWVSGNHDEDLRQIIQTLKEVSSRSRISLFVDNLEDNKPNYQSIDYALDLGAGGIEIHTGQFSKLIGLEDFTIINHLKNLIIKANERNLFVNAGHDLNLQNLPMLVEIGGVNEVSIGHAIIVDALNYGFKDTIKKYINIIRE